jgi:Flp pilus assembly protein TadD
VTNVTDSDMKYQHSHVMCSIYPGAKAAAMCLPTGRGLLPIVAMAMLVGCSTVTPEAVRMESQTARTVQLMRIANVTRQGGDLPTAATMFERASRLSPDSAAPLLELAETLHTLAEYDQAAVAFQKAIKIAPDNALAHLGYGRTLLAMGRSTLAQAEFEIAVAADPSLAGAHNGLGLARVASGAFDGALAAFDAGLSVAPDDSGLQTNRALCLALAGRFDEASAVLTNLAAVPGATARQRQNAALVYGLMGKRDQAARWARADLPAQSVAHNLNIYDELRTMAPDERARRVLGLSQSALPALAPANSTPAAVDNAL